MKYTKSTDGKERASFRVIVRLSREHVQSIRAKLRNNGEASDDKAVRDFVNSLTEYMPTRDLSGEDE